jgi:hypothetical protein
MTKQTTRANKQAVTIPHAKELAEHADKIRRLGKRIASDIVEIGARLIVAKKLAGHGHWLAWLDRELGWEEKTAERYMRVHQLVASRSDKLPDLLSVPVSGLYLLAAPSTPEAAREAIAEQVQAGEAVTVASVKDTIAEAKSDKLSNLKPDPHRELGRVLAEEGIDARPSLPPSEKILRQEIVAALDALKRIWDIDPKRLVAWDIATDRALAEYRVKFDAWIDAWITASKGRNAA